MDLEVVRELWEMQGKLPPGEADARIQIQHAVGRVSAVGRALLGSTAQLEWLADARGFATPVIGESLRIALVPSHLVVMITDAAGKPIAQQGLVGKTADDASKWITAQLAKHGQEVGAVAVEPGLPEHAVGQGAPFAISSEAAFEDVARSFGNAQRALLCLKELIRIEEPVHVKPDGLNVVLNVTLAGGSTLALGFCLGDGEHPEPYFYAKPCPAPKIDVSQLPALEGGGEWKTSGAWFGAILHRGEWIWYDAEQLQAGSVVSFLDSAIDALRELCSG